ncbi:MAG: LacI family DNA-binding transcriptional regulator [Candidatus Weimeria sp.]
MVTIKEIAKETGYGISTVSRVLNNSGSVSEKTRREINAVIEKYHFTPNVNAKHLKMQVKFGIAVIVKGIENMLFLELTEAIQKKVRDNGYECLTYYIDEDGDEIAEARKIQVERRPYGFIFLGADANVNHRRLEIKDLNAPCVLITDNSVNYGIGNLSSIGIDDSLAAVNVIEYLHRRGHTKIGIIGGNPEKSNPSRMRLEGCELAFIKYGIDFDIKKQYSASRFSLEGGYRGAEELLKKFPEVTAIFAMSDIMAIGAMRAIYNSGRKIPADVSIIGFDGIELARYVHPRLTTVRQNVEKMAQRGTEIMLECIKKPTEEIHEVVSYSLIEGSSVADITE